MGVIKQGSLIWSGHVNFSLFSEATIFIQIHLVIAILAFLLGGYQLLVRKGTIRHKIIGRIWVLLIAVICVTSFWIKEIMPDGYFGGYSPIHLLSIFALSQIFLGVYFARTGNILAHNRCMTYTYIGGLLIAGAFTFAPGRLLYKIVIAPIFIQ